MKSFIPSFFAIVTFLVSFSAFAQVAPCENKDGDKFAVCTASCVLPAGLKCGDCDDDHASINPGAQEIWDDGLDNDCKTDAWDVPSGPTKGDRVSLSAVQRVRFEKGLGRSIPPKSAQELRLLKDIMACKSSSDCAVDYVGGKLNPDTGFRLVDTDCDGVLNVVPDSYSPTLADQDKCRKANPAPACPTCPSAHKAKAVRHAPSAAAPVPGSATPATPAAFKASAKAVRGVDYSAPIAKAQADATKALQVATEVQAAGKATGEHLSALDQAIADQKTAITAETARAMTAEGLIDTKAQAAIDRATEAVADASAAMADATAAKKTAEELEKKGFFGELSLGGATLVSHDAHIKLTQDSGNYKKGDVLQMRGNAAPGGYVGLNLGYANEDGRFNGFFNLLPLADEGPKGYESSIAYQGGVEATLTALHGFGFHALFLQHDAGGSVVGANSYSRGVGGGLSYNSTTVGSNFKAGFQGRATVGGESYGAGKGSDTALFASVTLGINFGFGPK